MGPDKPLTADAGLVADQQARELPAAADPGIPDIPLPELPDIPLPELPEIPEIPELDLDSLTSAAPPEKKKKKTFEYGSRTEGAGPVSLADMQKMPPPIPVSFATPDVLFEVPETAAIQGIGMGPVEAMLPDGPEPLPAWAEQDISARQDVEALPDVAARADIKAGYVLQEGAEFPLDPELQRALLKVSRFLAGEFASVDRNQIMGRIRRAAQQGQQTGELLKLMIGPVLKLGKKRYAVINDLLKIKEDLPRQSPDVALALLEEILTGN